MAANVFKSFLDAESLRSESPPLANAVQELHERRCEALSTRRSRILELVRERCTLLEHNEIEKATEPVVAKAYSDIMCCMGHISSIFPATIALVDQGGNGDADALKLKLTKAKDYMNERKKAMKAASADGKVASCIENLENMLQKYPKMASESLDSYKSIQELQNELELTTTLPSLYGAAKGITSQLQGVLSDTMQGRTDVVLQTALGVMATVSACQLIQRNNPEEARAFPELLKGLKVKVVSLPKSVQEQLLTIV